MSNTVVFEDPVVEHELIISDLDSAVCTPETLKRTDRRTWKDLIIELRQLRPANADSINHLISLREAERRLLGQSNRSARLNEQRDGLGLTLQIAQLDHSSVIKAIEIDHVEKANSILDLLDTIPIQERSLLEHDARIFQLLLRSTIFSLSFFFKRQR